MLPSFESVYRSVWRSVFRPSRATPSLQSFNKNASLEFRARSVWGGPRAFLVHTFTIPLARPKRNTPLTVPPSRSRAGQFTLLCIRLGRNDEAGYRVCSNQQQSKAKIYSSSSSNDISHANAPTDMVVVARRRGNQDPLHLHLDRGRDFLMRTYIIETQYKQTNEHAGTQETNQ